MKSTIDETIEKMCHTEVGQTFLSEGDGLRLHFENCSSRRSLCLRVSAVKKPPLELAQRITNLNNIFADLIERRGLRRNGFNQRRRQRHLIK